MTQYIDKAAIVEELERLYNLEYANTSDLSFGKKIILRHILLFLDTLEVKESQKKNLWKSADGDDMPEIDREVIVLTQPYHLEGNEYAVSFAHRPDPKGWDGKSVTTGKIEHYIPKTYDKGGWNIPDVVLWLDLDIPNLKEDKA